MVISEELDPAARAWLEESCEVAACHFTQTEEFEKLLARADGLIVRTGGGGGGGGPGQD